MLSYIKKMQVHVCCKIKYNVTHLSLQVPLILLLRLQLVITLLL